MICIGLEMSGALPDQLERAAFLFTAAIMFAAPFVIIPARPREQVHQDRMTHWSEVVSSGYYVLVILAVISLGYPYFTGFFTQAEKTGFSTAYEQFVLVAGFATNLAMHLASLVTATRRAAAGSA
jgi:uncharacterized membrane protein